MRLFIVPYLFSTKIIKVNKFVYFSPIILQTTEAVVATHRTFDGVKKAIIESLEFSKEGYIESGKSLPTWVNGYEVAYKLKRVFYS
jgi:hypothetical protein